MWGVFTCPTLPWNQLDFDEGTRVSRPDCHSFETLSLQWEATVT